MALDQSALLEIVEMMRSADDGELMRRLLGTMMQALVDAEATEFIGAEPHQRTEDRTTQRNGSRDKLVTTAAGDLTVKIPKVRTGSFFPALLAPRRRIDVALHAVVMQAYVEGVSTRRVDDLVVAMGGTGISRSQVSRICAQLDSDVAAWRARPLDEQAFPYVFLDATYCKVRINARVVSQAVIIATGVSADGRREVLGCEVGDSETESFWDRLPARPAGPRPERSATGHQRQPARADQRRRHGHAGRELAALPGPLHAQRPREGQQGPRRDGRRDDPHDLRPARPG